MPGARWVPEEAMGKYIIMFLKTFKRYNNNEEIIALPFF